MSATITISEEIKKAHESVMFEGRMVDYRWKKKEWDCLFSFYNSHNEKKLWQSCRPCFPKVYYWIKQTIGQ